MKAAPASHTVWAWLMVVLKNFYIQGIKLDSRASNLGLLYASPNNPIQSPTWLYKGHGDTLYLKPGTSRWREEGREEREENEARLVLEKLFSLLCSYGFNIPQHSNSHTIYAQHKCRSSSCQTVAQTLVTQIITVLLQTPEALIYLTGR